MRAWGGDGTGPLLSAAAANERSIYTDGGAGATKGAKTGAAEFNGGESERSGAAGFRARKEGRAGLLEGLKGGDSAESALKEGGGDGFEAGEEAERAGVGAEVRRGARTTASVRGTPPRWRPRTTEVPSGPGTRAFTESQVGVKLPSTESRRSMYDSALALLSKSRKQMAGTVREDVGV